MNLEQTIRQRWASYEPLTTLVPLARMWTGGSSPSAELPFVVLDVTRIGSHLTTSSGRLIQHAALRFSVYSSELEAAAQIIHEIERRFERAAFAIDEGSVLDMRRQQFEQRRGDDGVWTITLDYLAITDHFSQGD